jgi:predicted TPR repeat methyltransferase
MSRSALPGSAVARAVAEGVQRDLARALDLHRRERLEEAAKLYRSVLQRAPTHTDALQLLGAVEGRLGHTDAALKLLRTAVVLDPANGRAHNNLGKALAQAGQHDEALAAFQRAAALMPGNAKALSNCSRSLRALGRLDEALQTVERALALDPDLVEALLNQGELLVRLRIADPDRRDEALRKLRGALDARSDPARIRFIVAALGVAPPPPTAPADFVATLFDAHAEDFDAHLVGRLNYRTPELITEALLAAAPPRDGLVLDLGCGTGLCAPLLRPLARRLVGVDLSMKMLDRARARGLYDELACAELVAHLRTLEGALDIAVAADVFVYVGDLGEVFAATRAALRQGGLFAFSVELMSDEDGDYRLQPTRRYTHSAVYLRRLAHEHGFAPPQLRAVHLREENLEPVQGLVAVLG